MWGWLESKKHCYPRGRQCLKIKLVITIFNDYENISYSAATLALIFAPHEGQIVFIWNFFGMIRFCHWSSSGNSSVIFTPNASAISYRLLNDGLPLIRAPIAADVSLRTFPSLSFVVILSARSGSVSPCSCIIAVIRRLFLLFFITISTLYSIIVLKCWCKDINKLCINKEKS